MIATGDLHAAIMARRCDPEAMAYFGNLTCRDCGLTFTATWGSYDHADEYRCGRDHVVLTDRRSGALLALDGVTVDGVSLVDLRGRCPRCSSELATGRLPKCPVCGSRDHDILLSDRL